CVACKLCVEICPRDAVTVEAHGKGDKEVA
ncbi:MAG: 4Fe-4S binding protein, partial [Candidatus Obscuribacterales bacterium]|nr:4Fe-4S binding protein [Candidatus Obscuribacterales bacterium]